MQCSNIPLFIPMILGGGSSTYSSLTTSTHSSHTSAAKPGESLLLLGTLTPLMQSYSYYHIDVLLPLLSAQIIYIQIIN